MSKTPKDIINATRWAGVVGAGGAGFPTYVKLQAKVDTIIANGSECEPLLQTDKTLMKEKTHQLVDGMKLAMKVTGAKEGIIAVKGHYKDVVKAVKDKLPKSGKIRLHLLDNYYPAGDEFLLVYEVTGKVIPEGGIPLKVGVVVSNVLTLAQISQAANGKPVTERTLTLAGEFERPQVLTAPIGTTYNELIEIAGGLKHPDVVLIDGGPMMGNIVTDYDSGIAKTTSGILALPKDHFVVRMKTKTTNQMVKLSKAACCQCSRCTDLCPRHLLGHDLHPHITMRTIDYNMADPTKHVTSAFLCSQCGVCEMIACDFMLLSPKKIYAEYRKKLVSNKVKSPHQAVINDARSMFIDRKPAIPMVMKKLDLERYNKKLRFNGALKDIKRVRIALNRHIGAPAIPVVSIGNKVTMGDVIAASKKDALGSTYHASIKGIVSDVGPNYVEIIRK